MFSSDTTGLHCEMQHKPYTKTSTILQQNVPTDKGACYQACHPEFHSWNSQSKSRKLTLISWVIHCTTPHKHNKYIQKKSAEDKLLESKISLLNRGHCISIEIQEFIFCCSLDFPSLEGQFPNNYKNVTPQKFHWV